MIHVSHIWIINQIVCFLRSAVFDKVSTAIRNYGGHAQQANIVSISDCFEQLYSCIFNSYLCKGKEKTHVKDFLFTSFRCVYLCVRDDLQLCLVYVNSLITQNVCNVQVCACCNHFPIT